MIQLGFMLAQAVLFLTNDVFLIKNLEADSANREQNDKIIFYTFLAA